MILGVKTVVWSVSNSRMTIAQPHSLSGQLVRPAAVGSNRCLHVRGAFTVGRSHRCLHVRGAFTVGLHPHAPLASDYSARGWCGSRALRPVG
eukprot:6230674-Prymnesium_polylepis.1